MSMTWTNVIGDDASGEFGKDVIDGEGDWTVRGLESSWPWAKATGEANDCRELIGSVARGTRPDLV
jgi:hypothetical protein